MDYLEYLVSPDFIAGWIAGSIGIVVTQPMDTIRIRMQVHAQGTIRHHFMQVGSLFFFLLLYFFL